MHWVIYKTVLSAFAIKDPNIILRIRVSFIILAASFLLISIAANSFISPAIDWLYRISATWLGTTNLLFWASLVFWIIIGASSRLNINLDWKITGSILFGVAIVANIFGIYNSFRPKITTYEIKLPNLPSSWQGRRAVLVSDTHFGNMRGTASSRKLTEKINELSPDLVFIPGDYYDGPLAKYEEIATEMKNVKAPLGVFFSTGNHEEFREPSPYTNALKKAGIKVLNNEKENVEGVDIIGTTYMNSNSYEQLLQTLRKIGIEENKPSILLKHAPFAPAGAADAGISLMLSGHTHLGQQWPFNLITRQIFKEATYGRYSAGTMQGITTSGYGTWGPPQRIGTRSEIVLLKFN
mgnify:CR=1 FL=1